MFCRGCKRNGDCDYWKYPKTFPIVKHFLERFNLLLSTHIQIYPPDWRKIPHREWIMLREANAVRSVCEEILRKKVMTDGKGNG